MRYRKERSLLSPAYVYSVQTTAQLQTIATLFGFPHAIRHTIYELHVLNDTEAIVWGALLPTSRPDEVMSILIRYLQME